MLYHDSRDISYRNPTGAVTPGTDVVLKISVENSEAVSKMICRLWNSAGEKLIHMEFDPSVNGFSCIINTGESHEPLWYYFIAEDTNGNRSYYGNNPGSTGGVGLTCFSHPPSYQITTYDNDFTTPDWFREGAVYHIFVDRFNKSESYDNSQEIAKGRVHEDWYEAPYHLPGGDREEYFPDDFFGGSLAGIIEKLEYIHSLGVKSIYLSPVFKSRSNHKYDTGDYKTIDPAFGSNEIFTELCEKAGEFGIRIILDGVFSHTGDDSIYFNKYGSYDSLGAYQSKDSPYFDWYMFDEYPDDYECWWGVVSMPTINKRNPHFREFICSSDGIAPAWIKKGASGWRLDVADELPMPFLRRLRKGVKNADRDAVIIGEVWEDASRKVSYGSLRNYTYGDTVDSVMNYPARQAMLDFMMHRISSEEAVDMLRSLAENYPRVFSNSVLNLLGSHDRPRVRTFMSDSPDTDGMTKQEQSEFTPDESEYALSAKRVKCAAAFMFSLPGVPCIYYGDEAGLTGMADPFNRATFPWSREDRDILDFFKLISNFRKDNKILIDGDCEYFAQDTDVIACLRKTDKGFVFTAINRNTSEHRDITVALKDEIEVLTGPDPLPASLEGSHLLRIPPLCSSVIYSNPETD